MSHDVEAVTARWMRHNADQRFRFAVFAEFEVGEMMPGTMVYQRMQLAIALQQTVHATRNELRRFLSKFRGPASGSEGGEA